MRALVGLMAIVLAIGASTPAFAKMEFAAYQGDAIRQGEGGTVVKKNGVDFWTTGTPPRKYKVLGVITDKRSEDIFGKTAVDDKKLAKKVGELGGTAVIIMDESTSSGGGLFVSGVYVEDKKFTTRFLVVQYIDQ
jgi:hypothetical protein